MGRDTAVRFHRPRGSADGPGAPEVRERHVHRGIAAEIDGDSGVAADFVAPDQDGLGRAVESDDLACPGGARFAPPGGGLYGASGRLEISFGQEEILDGEAVVSVVGAEFLDGIKPVNHPRPRTAAARHRHGPDVDRQIAASRVGRIGQPQIVDAVGTVIQARGGIDGREGQALARALRSPADHHLRPVVFVGAAAPRLIGRIAPGPERAHVDRLVRRRASRGKRDRGRIRHDTHVGGRHRRLP